MTDAIVTGGTGFIGSHLAHELITRGRRVLVLDRNFSSERVRYLPRDTDAVEVDVLFVDKLTDAFRPFPGAQVFHCAGLDSHDSLKDPALAFEVNVYGAWNVLEAARAAGIAQTILVSSVETFGEYVREPVGNDSPQYPRTLYGTTKVCMERIADQFARDHDVDCRGLRLPTVMGPGRQTRTASAFSTEMIAAAALGKPYVIKTSPNSRLPLMYVDDAARALCELAEAERGALSRRFYNLNGFAASAEMLRDNVLKHMPWAQLEFASGAAPINNKVVLERFDDSLAHGDWKWRLRYPLEVAIQRFIQAIRNPR